MRPETRPSARASPDPVRWARGIALSTALIAHTTQAAVVLDCGNWVGPDALVEPWEETSGTFARGAVRVALLDFGEPECCPQHLAVLIPANMYGGRACFVLAQSSLVPNGWVKVGIDGVEATRDAEPGLLLSVPVFGIDPLTGAADPDDRRVITLRVRQAAGTVELEK